MRNIFYVFMICGIIGLTLAKSFSQNAFGYNDNYSSLIANIDTANNYLNMQAVENTNRHYK